MWNIGVLLKQAVEIRSVFNFFNDYLQSNFGFQNAFTPSNYVLSEIKIYAMQIATNIAKSGLATADSEYTEGYAVSNIARS